HVELDSAALPGAIDGVAYMEVDFGTVERAVAFVDLVRKLGGVQSAFQAHSCDFPLLVGADGVFFRPGGQLKAILKAESGIDLVGKLKDGKDLALDIFRFHEDMGVVLVEAANPE